MTKISPVNNHLLIEPVKHEEFIETQRGTYEEIGIVLALPELFDEIAVAESPKVGDRVYFDSWLAAKYPKEGAKPDEFYWLVKWEDVRAVEYAEPKVSE